MITITNSKGDSITFDPLNGETVVTLMTDPVYRSEELGTVNLIRFMHDEVDKRIGIKEAFDVASPLKQALNNLFDLLFNHAGPFNKEGQ